MRYLQELLYQHECVTLPGFGAFLVQALPARVDQARGAFHPPLRKVTFNRLIQQNDGIVANYVAQREGLSYPDALAALEKEIDAWNRRLKNDLLIVPGIGEFSLTAEDKLRFLPYEKFNFDLSATGLSTFYRKPLDQRLQAAAVVPPVTPSPSNPNPMQNSKEPLAFTPENENKKSPVAKYAIIGVLAIAILGATYYFGNEYVKSKREKSTQLAEKRIAQNVEKTTYDLGATTAISVEAVAEIDAVEETAETIAVESGSFYSVIAGSFRDQSNAERKLAQLKAEGFEAAFAEASPDGLIRVAYGRFASKREAYSLLQFIVGSLGEEAWYLVEGY